MGEFSRPKTYGWVIFFCIKTSGLVATSIILPGHGWFSCELNKIYSKFVKFGWLSFIVHSLGGIGVGMCFCLSMG